MQHIQVILTVIASWSYFRGSEKNLKKVWLDDFECKGEVDVLIPMLPGTVNLYATKICYTDMSLSLGRVNIPCIPHQVDLNLEILLEQRQQNRSINSGSSTVRTWTFFDGFSSAVHPTIFLCHDFSKCYFDGMKPTQMVDVVHESVVHETWVCLLAGWQQGAL